MFAFEVVAVNAAIVVLAAVPACSRIFQIFAVGAGFC